MAEEECDWIASTKEVGRRKSSMSVPRDRCREMGKTDKWAGNSGVYSVGKEESYRKLHGLAAIPW